VSLESQIIARANRLVVDQHSTSPANLRFARAFRSRQAKPRSDEFQQGFVRRNGSVPILSLTLTHNRSRLAFESSAIASILPALSILQRLGQSPLQ